jgi:hypothetical protein
MTRSLHRYEAAIDRPDGGTYVAHVHGAEADDGRWEGWIVFEPVASGESITTGRETTQPNLRDLEYWATGLSTAYLEGALARAVDRAGRVAEPIVDAGAPSGGAAAPAPAAPAAPRARAAPVRPHAVLDPFKVYQQGEEILREELSALNPGHLRTIIEAHGLARGRSDLATLSRAELTEIIVERVRAG